MNTFRAFSFFTALSLALLAGPAEARGPKPDSANVIANAECLAENGNVMVTAFLEQKPKIGPAPEVGQVTYILEQHIRGKSGGWSEIDRDDTTNLGGAAFPFPTPAEGETREVNDHDFLDICPLGPNVNAIRAVVEVEVTNSNEKRNAGQIHTGRCSVPNPC